MPFDPALYQRSCEHYKTHWQYADEILYRVARPHSGVNTVAEINAKILIIGRSYATGIERQTKNPKPSALARLSEYFVTNRNTIDGLVTEVSQLYEPLSTDSLRTIVGIHGKFVAMLRGVTRADETPRSFASKYLHFHAPTVPIYDSYAAEKALPKLYPMRSAYKVFPRPAGADPFYGKFVFQFWRLHQDAIAAKQQVSVKLLDHYLWYALGLSGGEA